MKIYREMSFIDFDAGDSAMHTFKTILDNDKEDEFEAIIDECTPTVWHGQT